MAAGVWAMEHFDTFLRGRHFTWFTDHKPLEKLGKVHTKTLNRAQEAMLTYDFEIRYHKGSEMPADFLSRNAIESISYNDVDLAPKQQEDPKLRALRKFLLSGTIPDTHTDEYRFVKMFQAASFVDNDVLWRRFRQPGHPDRVVMYAPPSMRADILAEAHGSALSGHGGQLKTKERVTQAFY